MSYNKGGQWPMHVEHAVGDVLDAYTAAVTVLKNSTPYTTQGASIDVKGANVVAVMVEATGEALADDAVTFFLEASVDDAATWSSEGDSSTAVPYAKIAMTSIATTLVQKLTLVDVRGVDYIRVDQIINADASNDCTANAHFSVVH